MKIKLARLFTFFSFILYRIWGGFYLLEEVLYEVIICRYSSSTAANYSDKYRSDTMWCVGLGGCFIPHVVCWDGRRWCVEDGG